MKKNFMTSNMAIAFSLIAIFLAGTAFATVGKQDFVLTNRTGVEIHELYVSPHSSNEWQSDVLGQDTLGNGESLKITFDDREKNVLWDLKVVDGKGASIEWEKLDLTKIKALTLNYKEGKAWADVK